MNLLIFGATGGTGAQFLTQALERGHAVRVLVRNPDRLQMRLDEEAVVIGDIQDAAAVDAAFAKPVDAVISALGIYCSKPCTDLSDGTRIIMEAMQRHGVRRIGVVSSLGAGDSRGQGSFIPRLIQRTTLRHTLDDKDRQEALLRDSTLEWVVVRPPRLTNGPALDNTVVWQGDTPDDIRLSWKTSRATVATLLLDAIEHGQHIGEALNISEPA